MELIPITRDTFKEVVGTDRTVLIEWWAPTCGGCRQFDPVYRKVAEDTPDHVFAKIDVSEEEYLAEFFEIAHTPALSVYRDGLLLFQQPGTLAEEALRDIVAQVEGLDMDRVRRDMESEPSSDTE